MPSALIKIAIGYLKYKIGVTPLEGFVKIEHVIVPVTTMHCLIARVKVQIVTVLTPLQSRACCCNFLFLPYWEGTTIHKIYLLCILLVWTLTPCLSTIESFRWTCTAPLKSGMIHLAIGHFIYILIKL